MIRYLAIVSALLVLNPLMPAESVSPPVSEVDRAYETAYSQSELIGSLSVETPDSGSHQDSVRFVHVTGYSSTADQTDDTPFITASGSYVRPGVVAANWLPLGSRVKIPELFGDEIFVVEDRMNKRFSDRLDIWFPDRETAKNFGKRYTKIVIL